MKQSKSGFTIVEIMIVVIVIAILASIVIISYSQVQARSRDARRKTDIANIVKALELYYSDNGRYPSVTGSNSSINGYWYTSDTTSWSSFASVLTGTIDALPGDPSNSTGPVVTAQSAYNYAYFGGSYCGESSVGQMYILVYRYESAPKEQFIDGSCATNVIGPSYYATGASYYLSAK